MFTILLAEEALALEVPLEARLGAMAYVRCKRECCAGKRRARERQKDWGVKGRMSFWFLPFDIYKRVKTLEVYSGGPR